MIGGQQMICKICGKELDKVTECAWTSCEKWLNEWNEERMDKIGSNGNDGLHYEENHNEV